MGAGEGREIEVGWLHFRRGLWENTAGVLKPSYSPPSPLLCSTCHWQGGIQEARPIHLAILPLPQTTIFPRHVTEWSRYLSPTHCPRSAGVFLDRISSWPPPISFLRTAAPIVSAESLASVKTNIVITWDYPGGETVLLDTLQRGYARLIESVSAITNYNAH